MIRNPIIRRELVGVLRSRRALALQVGLAAVLALLVVLRWPTDARVNLAGQQAQQVLRIFGYGLMVGLILLAPAFPAATIVREKNRGTLALLLNSPMSPWAILAGKLIGVVGFVLLMIVLSIPAAAACYTMGGISAADQLLPIYAVLVLLAVQYATLGLLVSSFAGTTDTALRGTYGFVLLMALVTVGPHYFLQGVVPAGATAVLDWLRAISPIPAMMQTLGQGDIGSRGLLGSGGLVWRYAILAGISIIICTVWTAHRLSGWMLDRPRSAGRVTDERSAGVRAYRRVMFLWFFDPQRRSGLIGPLVNPVMIKEFRCRRFGRGHWMMRLLAVCLVLSLLLAYGSSLTWFARSEQQEAVSVLGAIMVFLQTALIVLVTPSLASGLISSERESGGWQLLQMTPLSPWSIIIGKLLSVTWTVLLILLATLPGYLVMIFIEPSQAMQVLRVLLSLALTAALSVLASAAISSLFRHTAVATATAYTFMISLCAGTLLFWLGENAPFGRRTVAFVLQFNPVAGALELIGAPGFVDPQTHAVIYNLVPTNWWIMGAGCLLSLIVLLARTWRLTRPT